MAVIPKKGYRVVKNIFNYYTCSEINLKNFRDNLLLLSSTSLLSRQERRFLLLYISNPNES